MHASSRAVANHRLGDGHGYSMEALRLEAWLARNEGRHADSVSASRAWLRAADELSQASGGGSLADPLAILHQRVEMAAALRAAGAPDDEGGRMGAAAAADADRLLGCGHPYARRLRALWC